MYRTLAGITLFLGLVGLAGWLLGMMFPTAALLFAVAMFTLTGALGAWSQAEAAQETTTLLLEIAERLEQNL